MAFLTDVLQCNEIVAFPPPSNDASSQEAGENALSMKWSLRTNESGEARQSGVRREA